MSDLKYIQKKPLEAYTRSIIEKKLENLGYNMDELDPKCNVYRERTKMNFQDKLLQGKKPDFLIYESGTDKILAVIEAKRPSVSIDEARKQAICFYAKPLDIPAVFLFNGNSFSAITKDEKPIKIDKIELSDFVDESTLKNLINNNFEVETIPTGCEFSREDLLKKFKKANDLLRKAGLRDGYERFSVFSDLLFLKLKNDFEDYGNISISQIDIEQTCNWQKLMSKTPKYLKERFSLSQSEVKSYLEDTIKPKLKAKYGNVFENSLNINDEGILIEILELIDSIPFSQINSDIKGDAFEYFLKNVTNGNKSLGEYYTPRHIVKMIVQFLNPTYGDKIYDPCCGTGGFLLECYKYLEKNSNMEDPIVRETIQQKTIYGTELTSTARIAKMNMILFGDGHSNIEQKNCLSTVIKEKFDIVVSNIPYSQKVDEGDLYKYPSSNGDSVFVQHLWQATKRGGKMVVIVPDTFLYDNNDVKQIREDIIKDCSELVVISLPRGVFNPYTPTKTSILYAKKRTKSEIAKNKRFEKAYLYVIDNDGFELGAKRRPLSGLSDCTKFLMNYNINPDYRYAEAPQAVNILYSTIEEHAFNLFPYVYMEHLIVKENDERIKDLKPISNYTEEVYRNFSTSDFDDLDTECVILSVTKNGIYINETYTAAEIGELSQNYKRVLPGDFTYNPHRINIGSIGVVPNLHNNMYVPIIYPVFRVIDNNELPEYYLLKLLKDNKYRPIINHYCLGGARANLKYEWLTKIKILLPTNEEKEKINALSNKLKQKYNEYLELYKSLME